MQFVAGSPLSDEELSKISHLMVDAYGEHAKDVVAQLIAECSEHGNNQAEHAIWLNVSFGVLQLLRPSPRWDRR